jgi:hypothetical protein
MSFVEPLRFSSRPHPRDPSRRIWVAETGASGLEVALARGSRHEATAARAHLQRAEADFRAGKAAEAIAALQKMPELYPRQEAEIAEAKERLEEWRSQAASAVEKLSSVLEELRRVPSPLLRDIVLERGRELAERYRGTPEGAAAGKVVAEAEGFWSRLESSRRTEETAALLAAGKRHFGEDNLPLAELCLRWVVEADPGGESGREAQSTLRIIEERRLKDARLLLTK